MNLVKIFEIQQHQNKINLILNLKNKNINNGFLKTCMVCLQG